MVDQKRGNIAVLSPLQGCDRALCPDDRTNVLIGLTRSSRTGLSAPTDDRSHGGVGGGDDGPAPLTSY